MSDNAQQEIVYELTNPAMPGLVKIGLTRNADLSNRLQQLFTTAVPLPFDCEYACTVDNADAVEKALHFAFGMTRINPNREFFKLDADRVIAVLKLLSRGEVTTQVEKTLEESETPADKQASEKVKRRVRPVLNFKELGISVGSVINFRDSNHQAIVVDERKVRFDGEENYLSAITRKLLELPETYPLQSSPYWSFNGRTLRELYEEHYAEDNE